MSYFAHSGKLSDKSDWQLLQGHLHETARLAARFAAPFGLERLAFVTALFHDLGKYDPRFQERLTGENIRVDHSTAGAVVLRDLAKGLDRDSRLMVELAAYAVLGHHAGLPDRKTAEPSCYDARLKGFQGGRLDPVWRSEIEADLAGLAPDWFPPMIRPDNPHLAFDLSVISRMLFSCLVDADFKDTEKFYTELEGREVDRKWPLLQDLLAEFHTRFDAHLAGLNREGDLNALRREILSHVRGKATLPPGLFTLTVPTGGGKTLASLGFALDHAARHGHRRIIYGIPFTRARIETMKHRRRRCRPRSRPPREGADRNTASTSTIASRAVALHARARIETSEIRWRPWRVAGRPPREGADRNTYVHHWIWDKEGRPPREGADRNTTNSCPWTMPAVALHARARIETRAA